jgi:hypothetical protein
LNIYFPSGIMTSSNQPGDQAVLLFREPADGASRYPGQTFFHSGASSSRQMLSQRPSGHKRAGGAVILRNKVILPDGERRKQVAPRVYAPSSCAMRGLSVTSEEKKLCWILI